MALVGPREQIEAALVRISVAVGAIDRASACLISPREQQAAWRKSLASTRTDLQVTARTLREALEELTPLRPSSRTDVRAAFEAANTYSDLAGRALAKDMR